MIEKFCNFWDRLEDEPKNLGERLLCAAIEGLIILAMFYILSTLYIIFV